jgi:hypothetical protein
MCIRDSKYYDTPNKLTDLIRIDKGYYNPDFILEIENKISLEKKYYIFDSKYSKFQTVKYNYLFDTVKKYILNTGLKNEVNKKVNSLHLLIPSDYGENLIESSFFEPTIGIIPSKPKKEEVNKLIMTIFDKNIGKKYMK